ncbi:MAG: class I SAM-dependent methyltransferase [Patescibacteria group bacterium]
MKNTNTYQVLKYYSQFRPLFLSVLRAKEVCLYTKYLPMKHPSIDVGCGDGFFARQTFGENEIDIGLDMKSSRMKDVEKQSAYKKLVTYDGYTFPFSNNTFNTVVSNSVFEHVDELPRVVSEIYRVLKPKGKMYTTVMAYPWEEYLLGATVFGNTYRKIMRTKQHHINLYTFIQWKKVFEQVGFRIVSVTGHGSKHASRMIDVLHYVSIPSLISYVLFGTWVLWPSVVHPFPLQYFSRVMDEPVEPQKAAALFFVLEKSI